MNALPLDEMLAKDEEAFKAAPAWTAPDFKVRQTYKLVNKKAVAQGPKTKLPDDPFTVCATVPIESLGEAARTRYLEPMGHALAHHARLHGAQGPEGLNLSIGLSAAEGEPVVAVTVSKVKDA